MGQSGAGAEIHGCLTLNLTRVIIRAVLHKDYGFPLD